MSEQVDKPTVEVAFDELAAVVREKDASGLTFDAYLKKLKAEAEAAARKYDVAQAVANQCEATKTRKPRCDRGKPRKRESAAPPAPATTA